MAHLIEFMDMMSPDDMLPSRQRALRAAPGSSLIGASRPAPGRGGTGADRRQPAAPARPARRLWGLLLAAAGGMVASAGLAGEPAGAAASAPGLPAVEPATTPSNPAAPVDARTFAIRLAYRTYDLMDQERFNDLCNLFTQADDDKRLFNQLALTPWQDLRQAKSTLDHLVNTPQVLPPGLRPRAYQVLAAMDGCPIVAGSIKRGDWQSAPLLNAGEWTIGGYHLQFGQDVGQMLNLLTNQPSLAEVFAKGFLRFSQSAKGYEGPEGRRQALEIYLSWEPELQQRVQQTLARYATEGSDARAQREARLVAQNLTTLWTVQVRGRPYDLTSTQGLGGFLALGPADHLYLLDNLDLLVFLFENATRHPQVGQAIPALDKQHLDNLAQTLLPWVTYPEPVQSHVRKLIPILDRMRGGTTFLPETVAGVESTPAGTVFSGPVPESLPELITALEEGQFGPATIQALEQVQTTLQDSPAKGSLRQAFDKNKVQQWEAAGDLERLVQLLSGLTEQTSPAFRTAVHGLLAANAELEQQKHQRAVRWRLILIIGVPLVLLGLLLYVYYSYPYVRFAGKRIRKECVYPVADELMGTVIKEARSRWEVLQEKVQTGVGRLEGSRLSGTDAAIPLTGLAQGLQAILRGAGPDATPLYQQSASQRTRFLEAQGVQDAFAVQVLNEACPPANGQMPGGEPMAALSWVENVLRRLEPAGNGELKAELQHLIKQARLVHRVANLHTDTEHLPSSQEVIEAMTLMQIDINLAVSKAIKSHRIHWADADLLRKHYNRLIHAYFKKHFHVPDTQVLRKEVRSGKRPGWRAPDKGTQSASDPHQSQPSKDLAPSS